MASYNNRVVFELLAGQHPDFFYAQLPQKLKQLPLDLSRDLVEDEILDPLQLLEEVYAPQSKKLVVKANEAFTRMPTRQHAGIVGGDRHAGNISDAPDAGHLLGAFAVVNASVNLVMASSASRMTISKRAAQYELNEVLDFHIKSLKRLLLPSLEVKLFASKEHQKRRMYELTKGFRVTFNELLRAQTVNVSTQSKVDPAGSWKKKMMPYWLTLQRFQEIQT